jgi:hypothetical protein
MSKIVTIQYQSPNTGRNNQSFNTNYESLKIVGQA